MSLASSPVSQESRRAFAYGEGARLFTGDGRDLLDFAAGGHAPFGHGFIGAERGLHVPDGIADEAEARLATRLTEISFADRVYFTSSAAAASECAFFAMWKYQEANKRPKRQCIVLLENGFHGDTPLLNLAAGDKTVTRALDPLGMRFDYAGFNDLSSVQAAVGAQTAGILIEPILSRGTFEPPQNGFLMGLRSIADEYDLVLAYDESQCGLGRTGALWAHEWSGAAPDLMVLGNNLTGGLPSGALLATAKIAKHLGGAQAGHPFSVAQAHAALDQLLAPGFLTGVEERSWVFEDALYWLCRNHPAILAQRYGMGLWQALKLHVPAAGFQEKLIESGLATLKGQGDVIGLVPPLNVTEADLKEAVAILASVCATFSAEA